MDCEKLISAVFERPIIWDKRNKLQLHANRNAVERKWSEISKEMDCEVSNTDFLKGIVSSGTGSGSIDGSSITHVDSARPKHTDNSSDASL